MGQPEVGLSGGQGVIERFPGGGQGEATFRSFMMEAIGKQTARSGGLGLAKSVTAEMLKMQGLQ